MSSYFGLNSYPHGGRVSAFLLISMGCAVICTCASISSCRFVTLDYQSFYGNFYDHFYAQDPTTELTAHRVGVGLFTWLRPFDILEWSDGHCSGYSQLQRNVILDDMFEGVRAAGILAVLMAITVFFFSLGISCLAFNRLQRYAIVSCSLICAALQGSAFLMTRSGICTQVGVNANCSIDQGGLIALAGVVLWMLTSLIGMFFIQPVCEKKLSPKMREQKRKEMRLHQLAMLHQLEAMERERHNLEMWRRKRARQSQEERQIGLRESKVETPPASPRRISSQTTTSNHQSANVLQEPCSTSIPEVLPKSREDKRYPTRKHAQMESPKGSPRRALNPRSTSSLDIYIAQTSPTTSQSQYSTRMQPLKKRRIVCSEEMSALRDCRMPSLLDDESADEVARQSLRQDSNKIEDEDDASDMAVQEYEFRTAFPIKKTSPTPSEYRSTLEYRSRDDSSKAQDPVPDTNENVEVYLSDRLRMIDSPPGEKRKSYEIQHQLCEV